MKRRSLLSIAALAAIPGGVLAQAAPPVRVRGTIASLDGRY